MSYCRWSDCDIYAYESADGYCIHVAGNVGLANDGESFLLGDLDSFRAKMVELREAGYDVPDYALAAIDSEIAEKVSEATPDDVRFVEPVAPDMPPKVAAAMIRAGKDRKWIEQFVAALGG